MPIVGLAIGVVVLVFVETTDKPSTEVLFSGQDQLPGLITNGAGWTAGALVMLVLCKSLAYSLSLSSFTTVDRCSPGCSSALRGAWPCRTFPACRRLPAPRWGSGQ